MDIDDFDDFDVPDDIFETLTKGKWRTREGKILNIKDMKTSHIKNCMNMIGPDHPKFIEFESELKTRTPAAIYNTRLQLDKDLLRENMTIKTIPKNFGLYGITNGKRIALDAVSFEWDIEIIKKKAKKK